MLGAITLTVDGKDHRLEPGSYFALTNKASHVAKAEGPWNVVMEK